MKKSVLRAALLSSASLVLPAVSAIILPSSAKAQTICSSIVGITSTSITCQDGTTVVATGGTQNSTIVNPTAQGLSTTSAGAQTLTLTPGSATNNTIRINVDSTAGIIASAGGALTVNAGDVNVSTLGFGSDAVNLTGSSVTAVLGDLRAVDQASNPLEVTSSGAIDVTVGTTFGSDLGVVINGGAGAISFTADSVDSFLGTGATLTGTGAITVDVGDASGSIGGLRINGGAGAIDVGVGTASQDGSAGAAAISITGTGPITIEATGPITTNGQNAEGILIQGGAGTISVTTANVSTTGLGATGISISGTGMVAGSIGDITTNANNSSGLLVNTTGSVDLTVGDVDYGGEFSDGVVVTSTAGDIDVDIGTVTNHASGASNDGVHLTGGAITATIDEIDISTLGGVALLVTATGDVAIDVGDVTNYDAGIRISAGANNVDLTCGNVTTAAPGNTSHSVQINATGTIDLTCGDISTLTGASGEFSKSLDINGGAGAINATIGDVVQDSNVANAVEVTGSGAITLTTGNVTSDNYSSAAIFIAGAAAPIDLTCGNVTVQSQNNSGVRISGTGTIDVTCGNLTNEWTTTSSGTDSLLAIAGGAGAINASVGDVLQTSGGSDAIVVSGTGPITLVTGDVTSTGPDHSEPARGVVVSGGAGVINLTTGDVSTVAPLSNAVDITGAGAMTISTGLLSAAGTDSFGLKVDGDSGNVTANVAGADTFDNAIDIGTTSGAINLTAGPLTSSNGSGIATASTTGSQTINVNGAISSLADAIHATTTTGNIGVNVNANIASSGGFGIYTFTSASGATATVNVAAGRTVTGSTGAIGLDGVGSAVVNNSGIIGTVGGLAVGTQVGVPVTINNFAGATLNGRVDLSHGADSIINSGTWNATGLNDFLNGSDTVSNLAGGQINIAAGTSFARLETLTNAGTINAASGILFDLNNTALSNTGTINLAGTLDLGAGTDSFANTGTGILNLTGNASILGAETFTQSGRINLNTFTLTGPAVAFTNSGFIDTSGNAGFGGFTAFNNAGTLDLAAGTFTVPVAPFTNSGTILADEGATTITGQTGFTNSGTLDLQDGAAGDVLTINSGFVGSGNSTLLLDFSETAADRLVITGAASGVTTLNVAPTSALVLNPDGLLVVDTGTTAAGAFVLGATDVGLIDLALVQTGQDFFLTATPDLAAIEPVLISELASSLWYQSADIYSNYSALRRTDLDAGLRSGLGLWGQAYFGRDKTHGDQDISLFDTDFVIDRVETKRRGVQLGVDYLLVGSFVFGVTGGYERAQADVANSVTEWEAKGYNLGAYAIVGNGYGLYGGLLVKQDWADVEFGNPLFAGVNGDPDIKSFGAEAEVGYRWQSGSMNFDLGAGLAHVNSKIDKFDVGAIGFDFDRVKSLRGRLGARIGFGSGMFAPFIDAKLYHEFKDRRELRLVSGTVSETIEGSGRGTWGRLEAGIGAQNGSGPILAAWGDFGDVRGFGLKAGWRLGGRSVEAAPAPPPPPPPPPPAPPPATQTCPDGSVILATDTCPVPPPPPPPPPPEPERG